MRDVRYHPETEDDYAALSISDRIAVDNAVRQLEACGPSLPYPHQSALRGSALLCGLRPRGGRSRVRPLYQRFVDMFVRGAVGADPLVDPRRFHRATRPATNRLA